MLTIREYFMKIKTRRAFLIFLLIACCYYSYTVIHASKTNSYQPQSFLSNTTTGFFLDSLFTLRKTLAPKRVVPASEVVMVGIDENFFKTLGIRSKLDLIPRRHFAELIEKINKASPKAIGIDFFISGKSTPAEDYRLASALEKSPSILPCEYTIITDGGDIITLDSDPMFKSKAKGCGTISFRTDISGKRTIRSFLRMATFPNKEEKTIQELPTFAEALVNLAHDKNIKLPNSSLINYYDENQSISLVLANDLLNKEFEQDLFARLHNKIVLIGEYMPVTGKDLHNTPLLGEKPGIEIHAILVSNILQNEWLRTFPKLDHVLTPVLFLCALFVLLLKPRVAAILTSGITLTWLSACYIFFINNYVFFGMGPIIALCISGIINNVCAYYKVRQQYNQVRQKRDLILKAFSSYTGQEVANQLAKDPEKIELDGKQVEIVSLSTDLAGFTKIADRMQPKEVFSILNKYYKVLSSIAFDNRGTVMGYGGDAMYVIWGAPVEIEEPVDRAIKAALAIQEGLKKLQESDPSLPALLTRIGIDAGKAIVGTMGGEGLLTYTSIGMPMNLTARLQKLNEELGTWILVSKAGIVQINEQFNILPMGRFVIRGITTPTDVFAVFPDYIDRDIELIWLKALTAFTSRKWEETTDLFSKITDPALIKAARYYVQHCKELRESPPPTSWNGEITSKG